LITYLLIVYVLDCSQRIMDVSELEKVHNAEKAALEEKEAKALLQLEEYLDQKVNALIEIGKVFKLDEFMVGKINKK